MSPHASNHSWNSSNSFQHNSMMSVLLSNHSLELYNFSRENFFLPEEEMCELLEEVNESIGNLITECFGWNVLMKHVLRKSFQCFGVSIDDWSVYNFEEVKKKSYGCVQ